ncbi:hypothetical protein [Marinimicrobium agarilyticum]|uniref:hypothetical protein n=1 Tax=Marinimicrobium agarilyticum TaxID=306546 RepID=UPI00041AA3F1|nr:hypothetical protein [Marinimicrobium agarilyticum]
MRTLNGFLTKRLVSSWPAPALLLVVPLLAPSTVLAEGEWRASVGLRTEYTDNANKSEEDPLSERQDEAELSVGGNYANRWISFEAGYEASERRFNEGSQEDRSLLRGDSELVVGQPTDPMDLVITHSRRTVLNAPDEVDLLKNNDERTILSAMPSARWRPTGADLLMVRGQFSEVDYRFRPERNSERQGASLVWQREVSEVDSLSLTGQHTEVSFDAAPLADYEYRAANLSYQVSLRQLQYQIQVGYNESSPKVGDGLSSPSYLVDVTFGEGGNRWGFNASQFITDNSSGSGNQGDLGDFTPGDSSSGELDQLERTRAELRWMNQTLCARCNLTASLYWQSDDYRVENEDQDELGVRLSARYEVSQQSSLDISWQRRDRQFESAAERSDFQQDRLRARYEYQFVNGVGLNVFMARNDRQSDDNNREYDETSGGLGLSYTF